MTLRMSPEIKTAVEHWAAQQVDQPSRSEAIRRLVAMALKGKRS